MSGEFDGAELFAKPPLPGVIASKASVVEAATATASTMKALGEVMNTFITSPALAGNPSFRLFFTRLMEKIQEGKNVSTVAQELNLEFWDGPTPPDSEPPAVSGRMLNLDAPKESLPFPALAAWKFGAHTSHTHLQRSGPTMGQGPNMSPLAMPGWRPPGSQAPGALRMDDLGSVLGLPDHLSASGQQFPVMAIPPRAVRRVDGHEGYQRQPNSGPSPLSSDDPNMKYTGYLAQNYQPNDIGPTHVKPGVCLGLHDNCIIDVKVACDAQVTTVMLQFARPFQGLVHLGNPYGDCVVYWPGTNPQQTVVVTITPETCPLSASYSETEHRNQVSVQFDLETATHEDVGFIAKCAPGENYAKELQLQYTVLDPKPSSMRIVAGGSTPRRAYRDAMSKKVISPEGSLSGGFQVTIRKGFSTDSPELGGDVRIGSPLAVAVKVEAPNAGFLDLKILSCWASSGAPSINYVKRTLRKPGEEVSEKNPPAVDKMVLEVVRNGCSVRPTVFGNFVRLESPRTGATSHHQQAVVFHAPFRAFRFVQSDTVSIQCKVVVCYGKCRGEDKPCPQTLVERSYALGYAPETPLSGIGEPHKRGSAKEDTIIYASDANSGESTGVNEKADTVKIFGAGSHHQQHLPTDSNTAVSDERPKRGTSPMVQGDIDQGEEEARNQLTEREPNSGLTGFYESVSTFIEFGSAIVWAKCTPPDLVAVTINDPGGFTGDIVIQQLPSPPDAGTRRDPQLPTSAMGNQSPEQVQSRKREDLSKDPSPSAVTELRQDTHIKCAPSKETLRNATDATILRRGDCHRSEPDGGSALLRKFAIGINSSDGTSTKVIVLNCTKRFLVLE